MANANFTVRPEQLNTISKNFESDLNQMKSFRTGMENEEKTIMTVWKGEAANKFENQFKKYEQSMKKAEKYIRQFMSVLTKISREYQQSDAQAAGYFK